MGLYEGMKRVGIGIGCTALAALSLLPGCGKSEQQIAYENKAREVYQLLDQAEKQSAAIDAYCKSTVDPLLEQAKAEREAEERLRACGLKPFHEKSVEEIIQEGLR